MEVHDIIQETGSKTIHKKKKCKKEKWLSDEALQIAVKRREEKSKGEKVPWTAAYQAPPSMGFSRQEYWSGVPLPSPICEMFPLYL